MKIVFRLSWTSPGKKRFKSEGAGLLFEDFAARIGRFTPLETAGAPAETRPAGTRLWLCDSSAKPLDSAALASRLGALEREGVRELQIAVGPADGFTAADRARLKPDLVWSFGPLTLPHELAAAVAAEQIYRAYSILRGLPYHSGH